MGKKLVIVESPAKSKTIGRYLGSDYVISASLGHIRDLPSGNLGVDVKNNFKPLYITMKGKEKVVRDLKLLAADADEILLATDPDREGEAIAWHLAKVLKIDPDSKCRITFNEITKSAVQEAIKNPRKINMNLANAQQARRILDRLVGYELSPLLWKKIRKGLSAGRVQSVATKIVMDRDAEIDEFKPEEYWLIKALVTPGKNSDKFMLGYYGVSDGAGKVRKDDLKCLEDAQEVLETVGSGPLVVDSIKKGNKERNPYPPFTTSTLQQEASKRLGFSSKKTMSIAQQLYEGVEIEGQGQTALVSYIRTDSVRISEEAVAAAKALIKERFGDEYCAPFKRQYKNKNSAQDAHEAIRPTHFDLDPRNIKSSRTNDQYKLYQLIWDRFLATQMTACKLDTVTCQASCNNRVFRATGETVTFKGFLVLYDDIAEDTKVEDADTKATIPPLEDGMKLELLDLKSLQKFTTPPPHYTEATLIKALEEYGIGRPSTYAPTISTILDRKYIEKNGRLLQITDLGKIVTNMLSENFSEIVDLSFTAEMENKLDEVEEGKEEWEHVLEKFYPEFNTQIKAAQESIDKITFEPEKTGEVCPQCGGELVYKEGRYGKFVACSNFPECNYTKNIVVYAKGTCPKCGSGLLVHKSKKYRNKSFYTCDKQGADPNCDFISWDLPIDGKVCPECGSFMVLKHFGRKSYPRCSNKDCITNVKKPRAAKSKKTEDEE
ncbi:MAG: type I DNA topoisomerase [Clostridiales bacterium]|nr:type I DNA topoisomerase [Clostridiales bacterium]